MVRCIQEGSIGAVLRPSGPRIRAGTIHEPIGAAQVNTTCKYVIAIAVTLTGIGATARASAADEAAGKKIFTSICAACHKVQDYQAKSAADLQTKIKAIVAGKVKHEKKLALSDTDIDNVVAYLKAPATK
jgi:mono/diheme cytochrome c family protein